MLPRRRRSPIRFDHGAPPHVFLTVEALYRKEYYGAFDCVKGELERHFLSKNFLFVLNIETMLIASENGTMPPLH